MILDGVRLNDCETASSVLSLKPVNHRCTFVRWHAPYEHDPYSISAAYFYAMTASHARKLLDASASSAAVWRSVDCPAVMYRKQMMYRVYTVELDKHMNMLWGVDKQLCFASNVRGEVIVYVYICRGLLTHALSVLTWTATGLQQPTAQS